MALNALNTSTAGLKLTQAQLGIVSQNIANAGTVGYIRRTLDPVTTGPGNSGVASGTISRNLDAAALKQLRLETSGAAYTAVNSTIRTQVDKLYGIPGSSTALDGIVNGFTSSLQTLASDPSSSAARSAVVTSASTLASKIGSIASGVQGLRTALESQLSQDTAQANSLLTSIADLNNRVSQANNDANKADLLDQRDQAVNSLSALLDVQTVGQSDGSVSVITTTGVTLIDHGNATALSFDGRGTLSPEAAYSTDPTKRGVGTITARTPGGGTIDLVASGALRSGSIAASLELRDTVLPQAQRQLDDLAAGLSRALSDNASTGTAATDGTNSGFDIDLTGLSAGNAITLTLKDASGIQRNLILVPSYLTPPASVPASGTDDSGATVIPFTIPVSSSSRNPATIVSALSAALGSSFSVSSASGGTAGTVRILSNGSSAPTLLAASASTTQPTSPTDTKGGSTQLALFVDSGRNNGLYTGSFDGGSQLTGFAQRIVVNPAVATNTSALVATSGTTATSDSSRPQALYDALTATQRTFSSSSGIGGVNAPTTSTVGGFAQSIIASQGAAAASAQDLDEGQTIALATAQSRFSSQSGVNIDEEMSKLIELQTAYTANARVLTAARDMLDTPPADLTRRAMTTINSFAAGSYTSDRTTASLVALKSRLDGLTTQLSSGRAADTYGGLGSARTSSLSAHATISALDGYTAAITSTTTRVTLAATSLTQVKKLGDSLRTSLTSSLQSSTSAGISTGTALARSGLDGAIDALNQNVAGKYIFGGRATDTAPVVSADVILNGDTSAGLTGLKTLIAEQKTADLGAAGNGRLTQTQSGTTVSLTEDANAEARANFGFSLVSATSSNASGVSASLTPGSAATVALDFASQPSDGDRVRVAVLQSDGSQKILDLTARTSVPAGSTDSFAIVPVPAGATPAQAAAANAATAANLKTLLGTASIASVQSASPPGLSAAFSGGSAASLSLSVGTPAVGDTLTLKVGLRDGTTQTIALTAAATADPASTTNFALGATPAQTAANLSTAVSNALQLTGKTALAASSTVRASQDFFDGSSSAGLAPRRVASGGNGYAETASTSTVIWYKGDDATTDPRSTASVQVGANRSVSVGARANEQPLRDTLAAFAALASDSFTDATGTQDTARFKATAERVGGLVTPADGKASVADLVGEFGIASSSLADAKTQAQSTKNTLQDSLEGVETISTEEVAAKLLTLQTQLQASYQVTSMLSKLSLVNYIS